MFENQPVTFVIWMGFSMPQMLLCLLLNWIYLQLYFLPWPLWCPKSHLGAPGLDATSGEGKAETKKAIASVKAKLAQLGKPSKT